MQKGAFSLPKLKRVARTYQFWLCTCNPSSGYAALHPAHLQLPFMKQLLFLLGIGLTMSNTAQAQFGVRVGGNASKFHTKEEPYLQSSSSAKLGYQVGLTYQLRLTNWLALVPEVQYSKEQLTLSQATQGIADAGFSVDSRQRLHYLNVPVLVRASLGPVYVEAGPQASVLLGGRQVGTSYYYNGWTNTTTVSDFDQPASDQYKGFDVGPCVGVGVTLPAGLGLSVRAYRGLVTLNDDNDARLAPAFYTDGTVRRQSLQASLTYQLPTRR
jgi:hypothetical protein